MNPSAAYRTVAALKLRGQAGVPAPGVGVARTVGDGNRQQRRTQRRLK